MAEVGAIIILLNSECINYVISSEKKLYFAKKKYGISLAHLGDMLLKLNYVSRSVRQLLLVCRDALQEEIYSFYNAKHAICCLLQRPTAVAGALDMNI